MLHVQTIASTDTRQQPFDPHAKRTISRWNVHPKRYEQTAAEHAQMQGTQRQDAVHPPANGQGNAGRPSWPWAQPASGPAQWAVNGRSSESGTADAGCPWIMATESTAPPQVRAARTIDGMCRIRMKAKTRAKASGKFHPEACKAHTLQTTMTLRAIEGPMRRKLLGYVNHRSELVATRSPERRQGGFLSGTFLMWNEA